jgi:DNA recombination protein RmuC
MALDLSSVAGPGRCGVPLMALIWQLQRARRSQPAELHCSTSAWYGATGPGGPEPPSWTPAATKISDLGQANAAKQAELAALRREVELLQVERDNGRDAAHAWNLERNQKEVELRRLDAMRLRWLPNCASSRIAINNASTTCKVRGMNCARSLPSWPGKIFDEREQRLPKPAMSVLANCLTRSRSASSRSKSASKKVISRRRGSGFPWAKSWSACSN